MSDFQCRQCNAEALIYQQLTATTTQINCGECGSSHVIETPASLYESSFEHFQQEDDAATYKQGQGVIILFLRIIRASFAAALLYLLVVLVPALSWINKREQITDERWLELGIQCALALLCLAAFFGLRGLINRLRRKRFSHLFIQPIGKWSL